MLWLTPEYQYQPCVLHDEAGALGPGLEIRTIVLLFRDNLQVHGRRDALKKRGGDRSAAEFLHVFGH